MDTMSRRSGIPDSLQRARHRLDHRLDELARRYAGRPQPEVLSVLEREVCAAGVTPSHPDLSAVARQIAETPPPGD
jgi:hypothetical protein